MYNPDGSFPRGGKSFNQCSSNMLERGGFGKKGETRALSNKQTNKQACLPLSSMQTYLRFPGQQCMDVNKMAAIGSVGKCDGWIVSHEHTHTNSALLSLTV